MAIYSAQFSQISVLIQEKYVLTGVQNMDFVQEEYVIVILMELQYILVKIALLLLVQVYNSGIQQHLPAHQHAQMKHMAINILELVCHATAIVIIVEINLIYALGALQ